MALTRMMISTLPHGTVSGSAFDDSTIIKDLTDATLTRIIVYHGMHIYGLTMHYTGSHAPVNRGGINDSEAHIVLGSGEFVTTIEGGLYGNAIGQLLFKTNKGRTFGPYGRFIDSPFLWNAADGAPAHMANSMGLLYFSGRANPYIHQLRATFAPYVAVPTPSSTVKFEHRVMTPHITGPVALSSFARAHISPVVAVHVAPVALVFYVPEETLCLVPFFRAALERETPGKVLMLPNDKPEIFTALLEHLHTGSYTYTYDPNAITVTNSIPTTNLAEGCFHTRVYHVALRYDWQPLVDDAVGNFLFVLSKLTGMDIVRLWKSAYENKLTLAACARARRSADFETALPALLKKLYETDAEEMASTVAQCPEMANDFMRLLTLYIRT